MIKVFHLEISQRVVCTKRCVYNELAVTSILGEIIDIRKSLQNKDLFNIYKI